MYHVQYDSWRTSYIINNPPRAFLLGCNNMDTDDTGRGILELRVCLVAPVDQR